MTVEVLFLRFDAPLVAFGGAAVDNIGVVDPFPGRSLLTGLLANALGWDHCDSIGLERLQARLRVATRCDRPGEPLLDYQTVDLGQECMSHGWTTRGAPEGRKGGEAKSGTHIRFRHYRADSIHTVALTLKPVDEPPTLNDLERAINQPARPLFIGRKCCLPSGPLVAGRVQAVSPIDALRELPRLGVERTGIGSDEPLSACWDAEEEDIDSGDEQRRRLLPVTDTRDWTNQVHTGRRLVWRGIISPAEANHE